MRTILLFILCSVTASFAGRQPAHYVFWGDSIMAGNELNHSGSDGPDNTYLRWPKQYAENVKAGSEFNHAQSGTTLCNNWGGNGAFEDKLSQVDGYNASFMDYLFIGYGFNDFTRGFSPSGGLPQFLAVFIPKLTNAIQYLKTVKGWPAGKIVIVWNYIVDNPPYNVTQAAWETVLAAVRAAVASEGVCLLDFHTFWKARSDKADYTYGDLIHPNESANTVMAANADALIEHPATGGGGGGVPPGVIPVKGKKLVVW